MKYFVAGILIICLIFAFCVFNLTVENLWFGEIKRHLEDSQQYSGAGMYDAALVSANAAYEIWSKRKDYLAAVLVHDDIDDLNRTLSLALDCLERKSDSAPDSVTEALELVKTVLDGEQFSLRNIF